MRWQQNIIKPLKFWDDLLLPLGKNRNRQTEREAVEKYLAAYPQGVPIKVKTEIKGRVTQQGGTFITFRNWKSGKETVYIIEKKKNITSQLLIELIAGRPKQRIRWLELTSLRCLREFGVFGIPAMAAACTFMQDGTERVCPICGYIHWNRHAGILNLPLNFLTEWDAQDYEEILTGGIENG